jgi:hypothetical protein
MSLVELPRVQCLKLTHLPPPPCGLLYIRRSTVARRHHTFLARGVLEDRRASKELSRLSVICLLCLVFQRQLRERLRHLEHVATTQLRLRERRTISPRNVSIYFDELGLVCIRGTITRRAVLTSLDQWRQRLLRCLCYHCFRWSLLEPYLIIDFCYGRYIRRGQVRDSRVVRCC